MSSQVASSSSGPSYSHPLLNITQIVECSVCLEEYNDARLAALEACAHRVCVACRPTIGACPECKAPWIKGVANPDRIYTQAVLKVKELAGVVNGVVAEQGKDYGTLKLELDILFDALSDLIDKEIEKYSEQMHRFDGVVTTGSQTNAEFKSALIEQLRLALKNMTYIVEYLNGGIYQSFRLKQMIDPKATPSTNPKREALSEKHSPQAQDALHGKIREAQDAIVMFLESAIDSLANMKEDGQPSQEPDERIKALKLQLEDAELKKTVFEEELNALNAQFLELVNSRVEQAVKTVREESAERIASLKAKKNQYKARLLAVSTDLDAAIPDNAKLVEENVRLKRELESLQRAQQSTHPVESDSVQVHAQPSTSSAPVGPSVLDPSILFPEIQSSLLWRNTIQEARENAKNHLGISFYTKSEEGNIICFNSYILNGRVNIMMSSMAGMEFDYALKQFSASLRAYTDWLHKS